MKANDIKQLHNQSLVELRSHLDELQKKLTLKRVEVAAGKSNKGSVARLSDDVARVLTIIKEKEMSQ